MILFILLLQSESQRPDLKSGILVMVSVTKGIMSYFMSVMPILLYLLKRQNLFNHNLLNTLTNYLVLLFCVSKYIETENFRIYLVGLPSF